MTYLTYFLKKKDYNSIIKKYDLLNLFFKKKKIINYLIIIIFQDLILKKVIQACGLLFFVFNFRQFSIKGNLTIFPASTWSNLQSLVSKSFNA